jgi:predicted nucleic acid-binding protein
VGELVYGAHRVTSRTSDILARLNELLTPNLRILPFDRLAAHRYGELRASLERGGDPIGDADTRIASIALVHDLTVVTGNVWHFRRVPTLTVENWFE